jgi:hypothetical protein
MAGEVAVQLGRIFLTKSCTFHASFRGAVESKVSWGIIRNLVFVLGRRNRHGRKRVEYETTIFTAFSTYSRNRCTSTHPEVVAPNCV